MSFGFLDIICHNWPGGDCNRQPLYTDTASSRQCEFHTSLLCSVEKYMAITETNDPRSDPLKTQFRLFSDQIVWSFQIVIFAETICEINNLGLKTHLWLVFYLTYYFLLKLGMKTWTTFLRNPPQVMIWPLNATDFTNSKTQLQKLNVTSTRGTVPELGLLLRMSWLLLPAPYTLTI